MVTESGANPVRLINYHCCDYGRYINVTSFVYTTLSSKNLKIMYFQTNFVRKYIINKYILDLTFFHKTLSRKTIWLSIEFDNRV